MLWAQSTSSSHSFHSKFKGCITFISKLAQGDILLISHIRCSSTWWPGSLTSELKLKSVCLAVNGQVETIWWKKFCHWIAGGSVDHCDIRDILYWTCPGRYACRLTRMGLTCLEAAWRLPDDPCSVHHTFLQALWTQAVYPYPHCNRQGYSQC